MIASLRLRLTAPDGRTWTLAGWRPPLILHAAGSALRVGAPPNASAPVIRIANVEGGWRLDARGASLPEINGWACAQGSLRHGDRVAWMGHRIEVDLDASTDEADLLATVVGLTIPRGTTAGARMDPAGLAPVRDRAVDPLPDRRQPGHAPVEPDRQGARLRGGSGGRRVQLAAGDGLPLPPPSPGAEQRPRQPEPSGGPFPSSAPPAGSYAGVRELLASVVVSCLGLGVGLALGDPPEAVGVSIHGLGQAVAETRTWGAGEAEGALEREARALVGALERYQRAHRMVQAALERSEHLPEAIRAAEAVASEVALIGAPTRLDPLAQAAVAKARQALDAAVQLSINEQEAAMARKDYAHAEDALQRQWRLRADAPDDRVRIEAELREVARLRKDRLW